MQSPFNDILHTNAVPSDAECADIRALLEGPCEELQRIEKEIDRLQSLIDEADKRRQELKELIDPHLALISPARQLPEDIIRSIFMETLPSIRNAALVSTEAPLLLCRISKPWRDIALRTTQLWAAIHIVIPHPEKVQILSDLVTTWISRSGSVPLGISMVHSRTSDANCDVSSLFSALLAVAPRWRDMQLTVSDYSHFGSLTPEDVPLLKSIALRQGSIRRAADPSGMLKFLATTSLRSAELPSPDCVLKNPLSLAFLTHLKLPTNVYTALEYNETLGILHQCPLLETCELVLGRTAPGLAPRVHLPHLRHLAVTHLRVWPDGPHFLPHLILPALRSFSVTTHHQSLPRGILAAGLFPSPSTNIECLKLNVYRLESRSLQSVLADMPSLVELHILQEPYTATTDSGLLDLLAPLCPSLRTLTLRQFADLDDATIVSFIRTRLALQQARKVVPLLRFDCSLQRRMQFDVRLGIAEAIADGLVMNLVYAVFASAYSPLEGIEPEVDQY
ncbi:hypothetical protein C8R46DRAFT_1350790 [Mycena filopes]|nr:hypothetical protein C8R46DRAFT_1350790 [Mycena filopes]